MRAALSEIVLIFERSPGDRVLITYGTPPQLMERLGKTDTADEVIITRDDIMRLHGQGRTLAGGERDIARVGMGIFVRKGAFRPEVGSVDGFRQGCLQPSRLPTSIRTKAALRHSHEREERR